MSNAKAKLEDKVLCPIYLTVGTAMLVVGILSLVKNIMPSGGIIFFIFVIWFYYNGIRALIRLRKPDNG